MIKENNQKTHEIFAKRIKHEILTQARQKFYYNNKHNTKYQAKLDIPQRSIVL